MNLMGELPGIRVYEQGGQRFDVKAEMFTFSAVVGATIASEVEGALFYELDQRIQQEAVKIGATLFGTSIRTRSQSFTVTDKREDYKLVRLTLEWGYWPAAPVVVPKGARSASEPLTDLLEEVAR